MKQDEIYELARQAGFDAELMKSNAERGNPSIAEISAKLVAAKEREECVKAFELYWNDAGLQRSYSPAEYINVARGEA
jgi:hypothetical protein